MKKETYILTIAFLIFIWGLNFGNFLAMFSSAGVGVIFLFGLI